MRLAFATLFLLLASCGQSVPRDVVTVRSYTDSHGDPTPHADSLGFTYGPVGEGGSKYGAAGFNALINEVLVGDSDPDRIVRVICHELLNAQVLRAGNFPETLAGDWYLWSGDSLPAFSAPVEAEAAWLATLPPMTVHVDARDPWLLQPVREAVNRLNEAAGREVFK